MADQAVAVLVALVEHLDPHVAVLDHARLAGLRGVADRRVERAPHQLARGLDHEREAVVLHAVTLAVSR